jgi:hypothetical protein
MGNNKPIMKIERIKKFSCNEMEITSNVCTEQKEFCQEFGSFSTA